MTSCDSPVFFTVTSDHSAPFHTFTFLSANESMRTCPLSVKTSVSGETHKLLLLMVPTFCWFDFALEESLYNKYGVPVSI